MPIKVIDLFAGPGGLGEGFSAFRPNGKQAFKIAVSIEKEESAHRTLQLRSLFRQFDHGDSPESYYAFLRGELGQHPEDELYRLPELQEPLAHARKEAQKLELGEDSQRTIYKCIRDAVGDEECVLIGGPPCQAYSVVGRSRNYGAKDKAYNASDDPRNFLYREYLNIIAKFQPMIFVMENVKGILSAKIDKRLIFESILTDLERPVKFSGVRPDKGRSQHAYSIVPFVDSRSGADLFGEDGKADPHEYVIEMERYGLPQARHRVILLGIRNDLIDEVGSVGKLQEIDQGPSVQDVISDLPRIRSRLSKVPDSLGSWRSAMRGMNKKLKELQRDGRVPAEVYDELLHWLDEIDNSPEGCGADRGLVKPKSLKELSSDLREWYVDPKLKNYVINHDARGHMEADLHRYLYYSVCAKVTGSSPTSANLPRVLWPAHKNFKSGKFADRFRVQIGESQGNTVTSHISKDGHSFIHYDPSQYRSLTVREAARIQCFPDNYYFVGPRTQQYVQVGNAVPPYLAYKLAQIVYSLI